MKHPIVFHRTTDENGHNRYVFETLDGREIDLPPDTTVSELQNQL